jgi:hypothetical protein
MFFIVQNRPSTHHDLPRNHHNFTTKTPRKNTRFSTPPSKTPTKRQKTRFPAAHNFF